MKVTVLVGGVGGARFLLGLRELFGPTAFPAPQDDASGAPATEHEITAIVNVGDDAWMHGVRICPDLDTCMYTLGGGIDPERGWGHAGETWNCRHATRRKPALGPVLPRCTGTTTRKVWPVPCKARYASAEEESGTTASSRSHLLTTEQGDAQ